MKKKVFASAMAACTLLSMTACATNAADGIGAPTQEQVTESTDATGTSAEDNTDASVIDPENAGKFTYEGTYYGDRCCVKLSAGEGNKVNIKASWGGSYNECSEWTMAGIFDGASNTVTYSDCVKKDVKYSSETEVEKEDIIYTDGTGTLKFDASGETFTWDDRKENCAENLTFRIYREEDQVTAAPSDSSKDNSDYYTAFSAMDKDAIEKSAEFFRDKYLAEDWDALKAYIRYPVMINGAAVEDEESFVKIMKGKKISDESRKAMTKEDCKDMFFNGQGLCLGNGQVWLLDINYMTDKEPEIKVITIQGLE